MQRRCKRRVIGCPVMIDVVCLQYRACKLREQIIFFVGRTIRADDADCCAAALIPNLAEFLPNRFKCLFPGRGRQLAILPNKRLCEPFLMMRKVKGVTPLDAEEVAVDSTLIAVISADDLMNRCRSGARRAWSCSRRRSACRRC